MMSEKVIRSYGAMTVTLAFLTQSQQTALQALNHWFYDVAVSRI